MPSLREQAWLACWVASGRVRWVQYGAITWRPVAHAGSCEGVLLREDVLPHFLPGREKRRALRGGHGPLRVFKTNLGSPGATEGSRGNLRVFKTNLGSPGATEGSRGNLRVIKTNLGSPGATEGSRGNLRVIKTNLGSPGVTEGSRGNPRVFR
uniref:Uncharacterized protein n=1 Tax=Timema monikensis TaxID=170555 RepID=A0A7R9DYD0_9NEOP|nr:unnamed protein product [Timema monikensis]